MYQGAWVRYLVDGQLKVINPIAHEGFRVVLEHGGAHLLTLAKILTAIAFLLKFGSLVK